MRFRIERFPKISVVTPSYNQGAYLGETLASLVDQRYPDLEVIVMDGASSDGSVDVIRSFEKHIAYWESVPDRGQSHAINKGFEWATGDVLCWLNSDDVLLPGALNAVAFAFNSHSDWDWVSGPSLKFGEGLHELSGYYELPKDAIEWMVYCPIAQPSTFWRRSLYERFGGLDERFHYALDYEYWVRFVLGGVKLHFVDRPLSAYRLHDSSKSVALADKFIAERSMLREKYRDSLTPAQAASLDRRLARFDAIYSMTQSVALLQDAKWKEARGAVVRTLTKNPSLLFTRTGAASLFRVLAKRPRYRE
jgi:glycosyltransferase involved in cell wall biosynthesis